MARRLTTDEFIQKAREVHGDRYDYSQTVYIDSRSRLTVICSKHGPFEQRASCHLAGDNCPICAKTWSDEHRKNLQASCRKSRGMTTEQWIERAKQVHGDTYDYSQTVYVNQRTKVTIICRKHGPFEQKADSHLRGIGCRACGYESDARNGHGWSDERRAKIAETCRQKYGADRYMDGEEVKEKLSKIRSDPDFRKKMHDIISSDDVQAKAKETCLLRYGVESPTQIPGVMEKIWDSKRRNGTCRTSKPEEEMYVILCERFGVDDVLRQYKESRYPFHCDFYIKSLDLFIELNASWFHGGYWFDADDCDDIAKLGVWRQKLSVGHRLYADAISVWTVRDVKKKNTALENGLNYLVFWKNNLSDFKEWLNADTLVLNNISD